MARYLVEVPHENTKEACDRAIRLFMETGSHFMTHADWGCGDGVHKAWFVIDVDTREEAREILPPPLRKAASVIALQNYRAEDFQGVVGRHGD